jgi:hypothetical protein
MVAPVPVPAALNASVFEPIRAHFPKVQLSNFAHGHRSDASELDFKSLGTSAFEPGNRSS